VCAEYLGYFERLGGYVADTGLIVNKALDEGKMVVLEGAQATLLDVDHGTYPFVTSSSPTAGGACAGSGLGPTRITKVIGIIKAYTTRVGAGPFPTELDNAQGEWLRKTGMEYGVTTGRERRTGWFDAVIARYATRVNGITDYILTKLDVLSGLDKVPVCVAYEVGGSRHDEMPMTQTDFHHARPVYEYLDGWWEDISAAGEFGDLPRNARAYIRALEDMIGAPVAAVGVGPRRDQTLRLRPLL
jgi:adenylosuccinate synthase